MQTSREFVDALRRELPIWRAEGLVTPSAAERLAARYGLDDARSVAARDRTGPLAAAAGLGIALALAAALFASGTEDGLLLPLAALAAAFAAAPLATRGDALAPAAAALRVEGRVLFYLAAYALSFVPIADALRFRAGLGSQGLVAALPPFLLAAGAVAAGMRRTDVDHHTRGEAMLLAATVVAFAAGLSLDTGNGTAIVATMSLAFLAVGRIVRGLSWLSRAPFLEGIGVATLLVMSRSFSVFPSERVAIGIGVVCLAGAIAAVIGFERRRARAPEPTRATAG